MVKSCGITLVSTISSKKGWGLRVQSWEKVQQCYLPSGKPLYSQPSTLNFFMRYLFIILGTFSLAMGIIGIFLPVLPTTPLLLLTAFCYYRGSKRMYAWLMHHPIFGKHIKNFRENRIIPRKVKIGTLLLLWASLLFCAYILSPIWIKCLMIGIAIGVTCHILS